jgi:hypothetical protein
MQKAQQDGVPLTPRELQDVNAGGQKLRTATAEQIGEKDMALADCVKWAMNEAAKVQNGADPPVSFPNTSCLFWYQSAVGNRREFEKLLLRVESPGSGDENLFLSDSTRHFNEIEEQIKQVVNEVGPRLRQIEKAYFDD